MDAIEVVARLGGSVVAITHLRDGAGYRIGTAPGVDLALPVATTFPLVDRGVLRIPAGIQATLIEGGRTSRLMGNELWLAVGIRIELTIGLVAIRISRVELPKSVLDRPPVDPRPPAYVAASLALHMLVLSLVFTFAPFAEPLERMVAPVGTNVRIARFDAPPQTPPKAEPTLVPEASTSAADPVAAPPPAQTSTDVHSARRGRAIAQARESGLLGAEGLGALNVLTYNGDLADAFQGVGPAYNEHETNQKGFGGGAGGPRFNPGTIATGAYETVSDGRGAGDDYQLPGEVADQRHRPVVEMCTGRPCATDGPVTAAVVTQHIAAISPTLLRCYRAHAEDRSRGTVTLDFEIDRDGTVLRASSRGFGAVSACVQAVVEKIDFPIAPDQPQTTVRFSLGFR